MVSVELPDSLAVCRLKESGWSERLELAVELELRWLRETCRISNDSQATVLKLDQMAQKMVEELRMLLEDGVVHWYRQAKHS